MRIRDFLNELTTACNRKFGSCYFFNLNLLRYEVSFQFPYAYWPDKQLYTRVTLVRIPFWGQSVKSTVRALNRLQKELDDGGIQTRLDLRFYDDEQ